MFYDPTIFLRWGSIVVANLLTRSLTLPVMILSQQATSKMAVGMLLHCASYSLLMLVFSFEEADMEQSAAQIQLLHACMSASCAPSHDRVLLPLHPTQIP